MRTGAEPWEKLVRADKTPVHGVEEGPWGQHSGGPMYSEWGATLGGPAGGGHWGEHWGGLQEQDTGGGVSRGWIRNSTARSRWEISEI